MEVRDAVEADADALASLADAPADVMRNLVHDRTVRVAVRDGADAEAVSDAEHAGGEPTDPEAVRGFVSFDVRDDTVHVTQVGGDDAACERLLGEPVRFARRESMSVELLVDAEDADARAAAERAGFASDGLGPTFDGRETVRYVWTSPP